MTSKLPAVLPSSWVQRFLKAITGQSVLPAGNIEIRPTQGVMCMTHTCSNELEVPLSRGIPPQGRPLSDEKRFITNLERMMVETGFGMV